MAVNEGLTVFNLVDGVVDEFHDESGADEGEGSNDRYVAASDYYINSTQDSGTPSTAPFSAGFTTSTITEPDTSTAGTNPAFGAGTLGTFTVPTGATSVNIYSFGSGGGGATAGPGPSPGQLQSKGGAGGFSSGTLAVTAGQAIRVAVGEGGAHHTSPAVPCAAFVPRTIGGGGSAEPAGDGAPQQNAASGGGLSGAFSDGVPATLAPQVKVNASAPQAYLVAGSGGGGGFGGGHAGYAGGTTGFTATNAAQVNAVGGNGGGGDQEQGGQSGGSGGCSGGLFYGGSGGPDANAGGGGSGYYGGGGGNTGGSPDTRRGGGGSSYYGHPQITSGATQAATGCEAGGTASPFYVDTGEGGNIGCSAPVHGEDGYMLFTGTQTLSASTTATTIVSGTFAATDPVTTGRIVIFEENVDTPTLNTDVIASISRDGGSNFTTATLTDSGYVTGSSGQRILTGQANVSGQPAGQSMRWKLALANNTVKIHGVSLQWS
jgi:hypothetical protein